MDIQKVKQEIVDKSLQAFRAGLFAGTSGNMSAYIKEEDLMLITPSGVRYETMTAEDIVVMHTDGEILQAKGEPSSEWRMHAQIYKAFPDTGAVFHTHSPHATAFAVTHQPIPAVLIEMYFFLGGEVPCAKYARPGTDEVGLNAVKVLDDKGGCLLENHGVLALGKDLAQAYLRAEYIEDAAKIYILSKQVGTPVTIDQL